MRIALLVARAALLGILSWPSVATCQSASWSPLQSVSGAPDGRALKWPSLVVLRDTIVAAGNATRRTGRPDGTSLIFVRIPGGAMAPPPGAFHFFFPKLLVDARHRLHMVWGEPHDVVVDSGPMPMITKLFHAVYARGRWSTPRLVYDGDSSAIALEDQMGAAALDGRGDVHVLLPIQGLGRFPLLYLRPTGDGVWTAEHLARSALYASIASLGGDTLTTVYVASDTTRRASNGRLDRILLTRITVDGGRTWSAPTRVPAPPATMARSPVMQSLGGTVHIAWVMKEARAASPTSIWHATISASAFAQGATDWKLDSPSALGSGAHLRFTLAVARCGAAIGVIESMVGAANDPVPAIDVIEWLPSLLEDRTASVRRFPTTAYATWGAGVVGYRDGFEVIFSRLLRDENHWEVVTSHKGACLTTVP